MKRQTRLLMAVLTAGWGWVLPRGPALAQEDFRSADLDRPIRVEDAYPIKYREWELETGLRAALSEVEDEAEASIELKTGLFLNTQAGFTLEAGWSEDEGSGLAGGAIHVLHNFNRETWSWPAFSGRVDVETPGAGDIGRDDWGVSLIGIVTRSFDRLRIHANAGYAGGEEEFWQAGLGFDYPIGLFSRAIMGDIYAEIPSGSEDARVWAEFGTRWQLTNWSVLDMGLGTRLDNWVDGDANVEFVVGFSRVFGIPALTPVPAYPSPRID